jgi:polar amino acid transport system substrate-binding protein
MRSMISRWPLALVAAVACGLPKDADGALERIRDGTLRVGIAENPPWVVVNGAQVSGIEPDLTAELARQLNSRVKTVYGSETLLLESLHRRELDLVVGGFTDDSPWKREVAFSKPYHQDRQKRNHVLALPPGENAWLMRVEAYLHDNESRLKALPQ